jgi:hypothetical protein
MTEIKKRGRKDGCPEAEDLEFDLGLPSAPEPVAPTFAFAPYHDAYAHAYGLKPTTQTIGRIVRTLKQTEEQYGADKTVTAFSAYVHSTPAQYFSIQRFLDTLPAWIGTYSAVSRSRLDPLPGEDPDAYIRRVG